MLLPKSCAIGLCPVQQDSWGIFPQGTAILQTNVMPCSGLEDLLTIQYCIN